MLKKTSNILLIGDLHCPFDIEGGVKFAQQQYKKYKCTDVIFMGDIIDNHYSSFHETDPDGMGGGEELERAIERLQKWYKAFPNAKVLIGNHDRIVSRKAKASALPKKWVRTFSEVLDTPKWTYGMEFIINDVRYAHGDGFPKANTAMKRDLISTVFGHRHTDFFVQWAVGKNYRIFGMQTGCLIDADSYAMAYGKSFGKPAIGLAVVLENGKLPITIPAELKKGKIKI